MQDNGEPSVPLPEDELAPCDQVVFARRRHMYKPFSRHLQKCLRHKRKEETELENMMSEEAEM
jgi:hypothetical protein